MKLSIAQLFENEKTVIIPGFGALTMVNSATKELMFMPYLKLNDGVLVKHVAAIHAVDETQAKSMIDEYIAELNNQLANNQRVVFEELGFFYKDSSGDVQFEKGEFQVSDHPVVEPATIEQGIAQEQVVDTPTEEKLVTPEVVEQVSEQIIENLEDEVAPPVVDSFSEEAKEVVSENTQSIFDEVATVAAVENEEPQIVPATEEEQWSDDLDLPPLNYQPERPKKPVLEKVKKDKKPRRTSPILVLLLAVIIMGGAAYVGFNFKDLKTHFFSAKNQELVSDDELGVDSLEEPSVEQQQEEEVNNEEIVQEEAQEMKAEEVPAPKEEMKQVPVSAPSPTKPAVQSTMSTFSNQAIQVIVGSFGVESNAHRLVEKLKGLGFSATIIPQGSLFLVSAASFNSMEELTANQSSLSQLGSYWIKK